MQSLHVQNIIQHQQQFYTSNACKIRAIYGHQNSIRQNVPTCLEHPVDSNNDRSDQLQHAESSNNHTDVTDNKSDVQFSFPVTKV